MPERPILVVDDDPTILATVSEALDMEGFPVVTATNGAEALVAVDRDPPSMVLLDMRMPVLDGWGFMRAIRERGLNLTVVVMTAAADARRWGREIGAQGVLAKPFELDELVGAVAAPARRRRPALRGLDARRARAAAMRRASARSSGVLTLKNAVPGGSATRHSASSTSRTRTSDEVADHALLAAAERGPDGLQDGSRR